MSNAVSGGLLVNAKSLCSVADTVFICNRFAQAVWRGFVLYVQCRDMSGLLFNLLAEA